MASILDHYKILGVGIGADLAEITISYKRLCRIYHPDVNADPQAEELMKKINIAYAVLRDKLRREAAFRERAAFSRTTRKYTASESRHNNTESSNTQAQSDEIAHGVVYSYFRAINSFDYNSAYNCLSAYDKQNIPKEGFIEWRKSVARLFPMREFIVETRSTPAVVTFNGTNGATNQIAKKFKVTVTEENLIDNTLNTGDVEKLVVLENATWKIYLGYRDVSELTRSFEERFETGQRRDVAKLFEEYTAGLHPPYNMFNLVGLRRAVSKEIYRKKRFGGALTFAAISVKAAGASAEGQEELQRLAAKTMTSMLRETDVPAYVGDGVFAIMYVELKKKNAQEIISRLARNIRENARVHFDGTAMVEYVYESVSGNEVADMNVLDSVLLKFLKKL
ncbi:MAG: J domain-containing protein [Oscillospiraceae bacterium]|nr:J domain-containing protein [Oscillospiraceae bacterium]